MNIERLKVALPTLEEAVIREHFTAEKLRKGDYLLKEGQICSKIAFLNKGIIRHYYNTEDGDVTRWVSLENDFSVSLSSFIKQEKSVENLEAIEDCELLNISRKSWERLYDANGAFKEIWIRSIEAAYIAIEDRLFNQIAKRVEDRFDYMQEKFPAFIRRVPVQYLASMLGATPRHLNRIRKAKSKK
jgi:CRP/FNR family transcriptional regulator, anaerobic regulatory protein